MDEIKRTIEVEIGRAIEVLTKKITPAIQPDHALKVTQAALNLAHVNVQLLTAENCIKPGTWCGPSKTKGAGS